MADSASQRLFDEFMAHDAMLNRLVNAEADRIRAIVADQLEGPIIDRVASTLARFKSRGADTIIGRFATLRELDDAIRKRVTRGADKILERTIRVGGVIGRNEAEFVKEAIEETWPFRLPKGRSTPPGAIDAILRSRPFQGRILKEWVRDFDAATRRKIRQQLQIGLINGESTDAIVQRLVGVGRRRAGGVFPGTRFEAETIVKTAIQHVGSFAQREAVLKHKDIIRFEVWTISFDSKVCERCWALHGRRFEVDKGPYPGIHERCRCMRVPVFSSAADAGFDPTDPLGRGRRRAVATQYADLGAAVLGKIPDFPGGDEWLRAQPQWVQEEVLGKGASSIWRKGDLPAGVFIDKSLRGLTLAQIQAKERAIRAGRRVRIPRMQGELVP